MGEALRIKKGKGVGRLTDPYLMPRVENHEPNRDATPEEKAEVPKGAETAEAPAPNQGAPVQERKAPVKEPNAPVAEAQAPVQETETPLAQAGAPVQEREALVGEPKAPVAEAEAAVREPELPAPVSQVCASGSEKESVQGAAEPVAGAGGVHKPAGAETPQTLVVGTAASPAGKVWAAALEATGSQPATW